MAYLLQIDVDESSLCWLKQSGKVLVLAGDERGGKVEGMQRAKEHSTIIPLMAPTQLGKTTLLYKEKQLGARRQAALQVKHASDLRIRRNRRGFVDSYEWYLLLQDAVAPFARTLRKKVGAPKECPVLVMYDNCSTHVAGTWKERCDEVKTSHHLKELLAVKGGTPLCNVPDLLFASWKARYERGISALCGIQDDLRDRPLGEDAARTGSGRRQGPTAEKVAAALNHVAKDYPMPFLMQAFVRQRKIPYDMMLRVAGISAERAGADHNILKAEIREALDNRAQKGQFGNFNGGRKRHRQDEEGDEENEENEEENEEEAQPAD
jgi:hypothetical protein